jgi:Phosphodiester glycosidase
MSSRVGWLAAALAALAMLAIAGCEAAGNRHPTADTASGRPSQSATQARNAAAVSSSPSPSPSPTPAPGHVTVSHYRAGDGTRVTLATFRGAVAYRLHGGSGDPGLSALSGLHGRPAVHGAERHALLAAFNGGFMLSVHAGGYKQEGRVISPLARGMASLVIDRSGAATIGIWGHGLPQRGAAAYSVRQNLRLLVNHGHPTKAAADWGAWGATLSGGEYVARSALGQDAAGNLIYAASMSASPAALAAALVHAGARRAMELDINPEWVQLDVARHPGGRLHAAIPGQVRPPGQYLSGWTRDFITVLASPPSR